MFVFTTKNYIFRTITIAAVLLTIALPAQNVNAAKKASLGKIFVTAALDENGSPVQGREDSVGDLQKLVKGDKELELVYEEDDADFKIVITEREFKGNSTCIVRTALYVRDGDNWKLGTRIYNSDASKYGAWTLTAQLCMDDAKKWIKSQAKTGNQ